MCEKNKYVRNRNLKKPIPAKIENEKCQHTLLFQSFVQVELFCIKGPGSKITMQLRLTTNNRLKQKHSFCFRVGSTQIAFSDVKINLEQL